jgi:hypothetical protein
MKTKKSSKNHKSCISNFTTLDLFERNTNPPNLIQHCKNIKLYMHLLYLGNLIFQPFDTTICFETRNKQHMQKLPKLTKK